MRWDSLFSDLEAQLAAERRLDLDAEVDERARVDATGVELADRLRGTVGQEIAVHLTTGDICEGRLEHVGLGWLVLASGRQQVLIPHAAAISYTGLALQAVPAGPASGRVGLASALRELARDRSRLTVQLIGAAGCPALHGVIDRVGRDFLDLAETEPGEERRAANVRAVSTVPFGALGSIRSGRGGT